jgi:inosine-uridine nucleoside N-ribohydrolase
MGEGAMKLHLDTDLGGDMDDLCALAMILNWPGVNLVGVTTNSDDAGKRAGYTRYALDLAGRTDVPVASGADIALGYYRVTPGLPAEADYWPEPIPALHTSLDDALALLERGVEQGAIIVAIGPYTNLALLERRSPGILREARLYLMGGYVYPIRQGFPAWGNNMDWNIQADVASAQLVLQHSSPTLIPLTVTVETWLRRADLPRLRKAGPRASLAQLIARQAESFARDEGFEALYGQTCAGLPDDMINFQHDPLACAIALGWDRGVTVEELPVQCEIEDGWLVERVDPTGTPMRVVTRVDGAAFSDFWLDIVTGRPAH